jgi:radical SAM-linked protein
MIGLPVGRAPVGRVPVGGVPSDRLPAGSPQAGGAQSAQEPPDDSPPVAAETGVASREEDEIINFVLAVSRRANMHFNVNVGTFIPKPHTPFQWAGQLDEETSRRKLEHIRSKLKQSGHKTSIQDPFTSVIEGVLSRGDERVGEIIEQAFLQGCRLDAWTEYLRKDVWRDLLEKNKVLTEGILGEKRPDTDLPWQEIDAGVGKNYLKREFDRSSAQEITSVCAENCTHQCGICNDNQKIVKNIIQSHVKYDIEKIKNSPVKKDVPTHRIVFTFSKKQGAVFHSHLSIVEIFSMAFLRAGIPVQYSEGFNPLPRLEIASPLSIGIAAAGEAAAVDTDGFVDALEYRRDLNEQLPAGLRIVDAMNVFIPVGEKKHSLSALLWGYAYKNGSSVDNGASIDYVKAAEEKAYRASKTEGGSVYGMERLAVLARSAGAEPGRPYFEVYRDLYRSARGGPA